MTLWIGFSSPIASLAAADVDTAKLPPPANRPVDYNQDIKPIFERSCFRCHGPEKPKSKFRLDNQEFGLRGGENGVDIKPGDSAHSPLIHYVARLVEDMEMPPAGKGDPLTPEQVGLLRAWIDQGAKWAPESARAVRAGAFSITPTVGGISVSGNKRKFREDWWRKEGFTAGYEQFEMRQPVGKDAELIVDGRALFDQNDYRVALTLTKPDLGFVRAGYDTYRKYFDDTGGYFPGFAGLNQPSFDLRRDLHLDIGRAWFDVGLTLPELPRLVLGYEYQYKDGDKSTLQWGPVVDLNTGAAKNIYPAFKHIDEKAHIIKADISYDRWGWLMEDSARVELYDLNTRRDDVLSYITGPRPDSVARITEDSQHTSGVNALRVEKQWKEWLLVSGGYLYSKLDGDASFNEATVDGAGAPTFGDQWIAQGIVLSQESHVFSASARLGPWQGLNLSAGVQQEWFHQEGIGDADLRLGNPGIPLLLSDPIQINGNMDKSKLAESVGVRFSKIPYTVLYAEGRFQQEEIDQFEQQVGSFREFLRDTDASNDVNDYRFGFRLSPWPRLSLDASYRYRQSQSDYDHRRDESLEGAGYPAFIRGRDLTTDEVQAKVTWRAVSWLKLSFQYRLTATDYKTTTDAIIPDITPGGTVFAGNYDAHSFSLNTTFTPVRRLYFWTTFSYDKSRTTTAQNGASYVVPYRGDVYSVLAGANYILNDATDLYGSYSYSQANYGQSNWDGLPLGIDYERHGLQVGINRRVLKQITASLRYGFYQYREPTLGGANDYTAHGVFASLAIKLL